ncbi:MAG: polysaccharide lyase [Hyphomicrobiaceae bacterium]
MIVKQHSFNIPKSTLFGIAGGVFGLLTIGLMVRSQFAPETYASCTERYAQAGMFALERSTGKLLRPTELQSKLGGNEWGVLHNIAVSAERSSDPTVAMTVNFKAGGKADFAKRRAPSGVGFNWQPGHLRRASAACLSYSVKLPEKFKFGHGGTLPGLFGAPRTARPAETEAFSTRMRWLGLGKIGVQPITPKERKGYLMVLNEKRLEMPRGQWVGIEQEVVLNTPGLRDGVLRIWVDGALQLNLGGLAFRKDAGTRFKGVIADTHYANSVMEWAPAPTDTKVKLSPMIVRWND